MSRPDSDTVPLVSSTNEENGLFERNIRLPSYQRDFAWDMKKMRQLWNDLLTHLVQHSQSGNKRDHYFLGTIVIDEQGTTQYLVDGQQRITTIYLISCALRDALLVTGFQDIAHDIHHNIIVNTDKIGKHSNANRYVLLDIPEGGDERSFEVRISPYRKRPTYIKTGLVTVDQPVDETGKTIKVSRSRKVKWTVDPTENWKFKLWNPRRKKFLDYTLMVSDSDDNRLRKGDNPPGHIELDNKSSTSVANAIRYMNENEGALSSELEITGGLEIVLLSNVKWPIGGYPLDILETPQTKKSMNKYGECDLFHPEYREFYLRVRTSAEHFIKGEKSFTPAAGISEEEKSATLYLQKNEPEGEIQHSSRSPKKGEVLEFIETRGDAHFPSPEQLLQLIKGGDDETPFLEFKQSFKKFYPHPNTGIPKLSKIMIEMAVKSVAGFLNSRGGLLLVGIRDGDTEIVGINNEPYFSKQNPGEWSDSEAKRAFSQRIRSYIGTAASKFVDYKVYEFDYKKVMCVKVEKWPLTTKPVKVKISKKWDRETGERISEAREYALGRDADEMLSMSGEELDEHIRISQYLGNRLGAEYSDNTIQDLEIKHEFEIDKFDGIPDKDKTTILTGFPRVHGSIKSEHGNIPPHAVCKIPYLEPRKEWPSHLDSAENRAKELYKLIKNTCFSKVVFHSNPKAAITHFMLANNSNRFEPLNAYDLTSSFTQKLVDTANGKTLNEYQIKIKEVWDKLSTNLYIDSNKDDDKINKYFEHYLLASLKLKTSTSRFNEKQTWEGLEKEFDRRTFENGEFDYPKMAELYNEMADFMIAYLRATNDNSQFWGFKPYFQAECRDERTYLSIIYNTGSRQHLAPYIALVNTVESQNADRFVISQFLKNFNYIWLRYITLSNLRGTAKPFTPGFIYGLQTKMEGGWIREIENADLTDPEEQARISKLPLDCDIKARETAELGEQDVDTMWPWIIDHPQWAEMNVGGTLATKQISHILYSVERALEPGKETNQNPQMPRIHGTGTSVQIEHIIPQTPTILGGTWYSNGEKTKHHKKYVYALGNHCLLEDTKNAEAGNKIPEEKKKSYRGSDFKLAKLIAEDINQSGTWDVKEIERNSIRIMNELIEFYTP